MDNNKIQITKEGLNSLNKELEELKETKRPLFVERLSRARQEGDLAENNDYQNAKDDLEFLDGRILELEEVLKKAVVVERDGGSDQVAVGARVTLEAKGKKLTYHLVGEWEADPAESKISHTSPLGKALSGKKVGEKVDVEAPAGRVTYKILKIE